jgi:hypothetical protein
MDSQNTEYLGDSVYAHFDGYGVGLTLGSHRNECMIYMEREVALKLLDFLRRKTDGELPQK